MLSISDNMGKKSLVALMAVSALVPVMSVQVSADTPNAESDFKFEGGVITEYVGTSEDVVIPETIDGVAVTGIGSNAFFTKKLTSVTIPNSVTSIGEGAFFNNSLNSVTIPNSVTEIGNEAFSNNVLTSVTIPNSVTSIGSEAFHNNYLSWVVISNSVTEIGNFAFQYNDLTSVEIPDSVTSIGTSAFIGNPLKELHIGKNAKFEGSVFGLTVIYSEKGNNNGQKFEKITVDPDNPYFTFEDGILYSKDKTIVWNATKGWNKSGLNGVVELKDYAFLNTGVKGQLDIPDTVTEIGSNAFYDNDLTSVEIPNSVTFIGSGAYQNNPLTQVTIPETVTSIGSNAFRPSSPLTTEDVPIYGETGSQAETYADDKGHPFNPSDDIESTQEATLNLFGGTLSLDAPLFEPFGTVELTSEVQVVKSSFLDSFKVYDARGTGEGWRLDVTSTQMELVEPEDGFKEGTSTHVLPVGTLALDPLESIEPFEGSNGILPSPILDTTSLIDDGAVTIAKADVGEGMGAFELTFGEGAFSATIDPSTAKIDKVNYPDSDTPYEATVTWTLVSAP